MTPFDVVAVGRACLDEILEVDAYPNEDSKVGVLSRLREGGGQASTAACLAAHLGGHVGFVGVLGADPAGDRAWERMVAFGVDLSGVPARRGRTPTAWCLASRSRGTRTIVYEPSPSEGLTWEETRARIARARVVLVDRQGEHLLPDLVPFCGGAGIRVVGDAERAVADWEQTWGRVNVLAMSQSFLRQIHPGRDPADALRRVAERSGGWCCATLGAQGAIGRIEGRVVRVPAPRVEVRDTTGAGDVFHGALSLALAREVAREDALRFAVAAASLSCRGLGGRSFPSPAEVEALWPRLDLVPA